MSPYHLHKTDKTLSTFVQKNIDQRSKFPLYIENLLKKDLSFAVNMDPRSVPMLMVLTSGDALLSPSHLKAIVDYYELTEDEVVMLPCTNRAPMLQSSGQQSVCPLAAEFF